MRTSPFDHLWNGDVFQSSLYIGINLENILYGMELLLYFKTLHIILFERRVRRKTDTFYVIFSSIMLLLITIWVAIEAMFGQEVWLLNPGFPGGPNAYWQIHIADWYLDLGTSAIIVLQLMTDGLMIHRCRIVWDSYRAIIFPFILWLASLTLGVMFDWTSSIPGANVFTGISSRLGLAYWVISVVLNTVLTGMICYRIVRHGKRVQEHLGREYASMYFTVTTMVVESVLPYTLSGIAFLVSFGLGSSTSVAFGSVCVLMMCISPQMLILRVIVGRAWDTETTKVPRNSTIRFSFMDTNSRSQQFDSSAARIHLQTLSNVYLPNGLDKV